MIKGINDLEFEKFKESTVTAGEKAIKVVNPDGSNVGGSVTITGGATSSNQTNGSQKTQIVDAGGEAVTVTGGKLDVNASVDTTGLALDATLTDASQKTQIVDGSGNIIGATSNALDVNIKSGASSGTQYTEGDTDASITGTAILWEDTSDTLRPVSAAKPLPVSVAGGGDATAANQTTIIGHVDGIETVLGTIDTDTSNLSTKIDTIAGAVSGTEMQVDVLTLPSVSGTVTANAGTNLNTSALALETGGNLASIKTNTDKIPALGQALAAASVPVILPAATITTLTPPAAITGFATEAGHIATIDTSTAAINTLVGAKTDAKSTATDGTSVSAMQVLKQISASVQAPPSQAVTNAGTFATQIDGAALTALQLIDNLAVAVDGNYLNVNANIAGTDMVSGSGTSTGALRVELPTNGTGVIATVGAVTAITNALPAGTNAIGKLAANSGVDIGDVDVASIAAGDNNIGNVDIASIAAGTNAIGKLLPPDVDVTAHSNYARKYYTSAGAATDGIVWSPAAGKRWHVVALHIQTSAAATITLEDDKAGGDDPVWKGEFAANGGAFEVYPEKYPLASGEDAADLLITTSAGNVYVTVVGYEV